MAPCVESGRVCVHACVCVGFYRLLFVSRDHASNMSALFVGSRPAVSYLQGPAGEREEEEGGHREREGADGAGEAGPDAEAVPV